MKLTNACSKFSGTNLNNQKINLKEHSANLTGKTYSIFCFFSFIYILKRCFTSSLLIAMFMMLKLRSALPFLLKVRTLNILYSQRRNRVCIVAWVTGGIGSKFPGFLLLPGRPTCVPILFFLPSLSSVFFFPFVCSPSLSFVLSLSVLAFCPFFPSFSFSTFLFLPFHPSDLSVLSCMWISLEFPDE